MCFLLNTHALPKEPIWTSQTLCLNIGFVPAHETDGWYHNQGSKYFVDNTTSDTTLAAAPMDYSAFLQRCAKRDNASLVRIDDDIEADFVSKILSQGTDTFGPISIGNLSAHISHSLGSFFSLC